jgi:hypothetical protein
MKHVANLTIELDDDINEVHFQITGEKMSENVAAHIALEMIELLNEGKTPSSASVDVFGGSREI